MSQDWTTVVIQKTAKQSAVGKSSAQQLSIAKSTGAVATEKKFGATENKSAHVTTGNLRNLEDSTDEFKHKTVDESLSKAITAARLARKLTQKDLATAINERPQIIQEYESGKAIPNSQILLKLDKALGTHLPRGKK